jgi:hypothetical protein
MQFKDNSSLSLFKKICIEDSLFYGCNKCSHDISDFQLSIFIELDIKLKNQIKKDILSKIGI